MLDFCLGFDIWFLLHTPFRVSGFAFRVSAFGVLVSSFGFRDFVSGPENPGSKIRLFGRWKCWTRFGAKTLPRSSRSRASHNLLNQSDRYSILALCSTFSGSVHCKNSAEPELCRPRKRSVGSKKPQTLDEIAVVQGVVVQE